MNDFKNKIKLVFKRLIDDKSLVTTFLSFVIIVPLILTDTTASDNVLKLFNNQYVIILIVIIITISVLIPFIVKFLNSDRRNKYYLKERELTRRHHDIVSNQITSIMTGKNKSRLSSDNNLSGPEERIYRKIEANVEQSILFKIEERIRKRSEDSILTRKIAIELNPIIRNTEKYIYTLEKNSIINLVIGITGTVISVSILSISILSNENYETWQDFTTHLIPRITFVIFIQLFAFFFLRLYKNNLEDGKYFQNELTNLYAKISALKIAVLTDNVEKQSEILTNLSQVERNFKLQKEETLLNIEKAKIEKEYDLEMLSAFKDFLKIYKKE